MIMTSGQGPTSWSLETLASPLSLAVAAAEELRFSDAQTAWHVAAPADPGDAAFMAPHRRPEEPIRIIPLLGFGVGWFFSS
jgi:hypothetical protein